MQNNQINPCDTQQKHTTTKGLILFFITGIFFGIVMSKSEAISWFRIYEMFRFESIHMYGIITVAIVFGLITTQFFKKTNAKDIYGNKINFNDKAPTPKRYLFGGIIFGLGWAMSGACPGPMFTIVGYGVLSFIVVIISAMLGTFAYGMIKDKLPH